MGILAWGPLGQGMLTGRVRRGQDNDVIRAKFHTAFSDERRLDAVEQLIPLAEEAGVSPGTDIGTLDQAQAYVPPAIQKTELRRRPLSERSAA